MMQEGGASSLLVLYKGPEDSDTVASWAKQWIENHPHALRSKPVSQIKREIDDVLRSGRAQVAAPSTSVTWFRFTAPGMTPVVGAVQGSGGVIHYGVDESTRKMRRQTRLARSGDRLDVYEPRRGHVRVFPDYGPGGSGRHVDVDLRRASFEVVAIPGDPVPSARGAG